VDYVTTSVLTLRSSRHNAFSDGPHDEAHDFTRLHAPLDIRECVLDFLDLSLDLTLDLFAALGLALALTVHIHRNRFHFLHQAFTRFL